MDDIKDIIDYLEKQIKEAIDNAQWRKAIALMKTLEILYDYIQ